ncbi:MAG: Xaa-Pro peptidase family protein [Anaerolineales bacterium]
MKGDIDRLMSEAGLDALWISGAAGSNPNLDYFVGGAHLSSADLIKPANQPATLFVYPMERDEAAATGLRVEVNDPAEDIRRLEQVGGDKTRAGALRVRDSLRRLNISGKVAVYGQVDAGHILALVRHLELLLPECTFVSDNRSTGVLLQARMTKDDSQVDAIRRMGEITVEVVEAISVMLRHSRVEQGMLVDQTGEPVTIGQVKAQAHLLLAERMAESSEGPIFAQGRDGALGHSTGTDSESIRLGVPIVFDIYPRGLAGGYYFDFTRTWCLGQAPDPVRRLYEDVHQVYQAVFPMLTAGASPKQLQIEVCRRFEEMGHPTVLSEPNTRSGYFHGLAHGLGLQIHEPPIFRHFDTEDEFPLEPGMVVTFEPGLYYPEQGMGVRLEDTVLILPDGGAEVLVPYRHNLVLPLESPAGG